MKLAFGKMSKSLLEVGQDGTVNWVELITAEDGLVQGIEMDRSVVVRDCALWFWSRTYCKLAAIVNERLFVNKKTFQVARSLSLMCAAEWYC